MKVSNVSGRRWVIVLVGLLGADRAIAEETDEGAIQASAPTDPIEEIVVEGRRLGKLNPIVMLSVRKDNGLGGRLYRQGRYKEALPYLMTAAESGFKLAQARVSYIYQLGLGGVPRNVRHAVGWLGVAATPTTSPPIRNYFKKFIAHIPAEHMPLVSKIVEDYTAKYGSEAVGLFCKNARLAGTHVSRLKCDFKNEFRFRDQLDEGDNADAFEESAQTASVVSTPF